MGLDQMTREYRRLAIVHGGSPNIPKANRAYKKLVALKRKLFEAGLDAAQVIMTLLDDESIFVRFHAAFDTLSLDPDLALSVLRELAAGPRSETRLSAERTLEFWNAGTLELPEWKQPGWRERWRERHES